MVRMRVCICIYVCMFHLKQVCVFVIAFIQPPFRKYKLFCIAMGTRVK